MRVAERAEQTPVVHGQPESRSTAGADPVQRSVAWSRKLTSFATGISFRLSRPRHPLCSPPVAAFGDTMPPTCSLPRGTYARNDDGISPDPCASSRTCWPSFFQSPDSLAPPGLLRELWNLCELPRPRSQARRRAYAARPAPRRPCRLHDVESLRPPGSLFWRAVRRRHFAYLESSPPSSRNCRNRPPRGRPFSHHRRYSSARAREVPQRRPL